MLCVCVSDLITIVREVLPNMIKHSLCVCLCVPGQSRFTHHYRASLIRFVVCEGRGRHCKSVLMGSALSQSHCSSSAQCTPLASRPLFSPFLPLVHSALLHHLFHCSLHFSIVFSTILLLC